MKLRCTTDSIRIRIRKSELAQLAREEMIEEQVRLGGGLALRFRLVINHDTEVVGASMDDHLLIVALPKGLSKQWIGSNEVSIEAYQAIDDTDRLHILIEKDFPCQDRASEDKSDTFWELVPEEPDAC
ncbi:MAG: hypothetical protein AAFQ87_11835 [Bacteroidota bacterium]